MGIHTVVTLCGLADTETRPTASLVALAPVLTTRVVATRHHGSAGMTLARLAEAMDRRKLAAAQGTPTPTAGTAAPATEPAPAPATRCGVLHLVGMTPTNADRLAGYFELARRHGFGTDDAEHIADRLQMRDRLLLDMAMCIECRRLEGRRCGAARAGQMTSASRQFEPIRTELIRCEHFKPNTKD